MLYSMTGYGKAETIFQQKGISVEIRALNSKYLDLGLPVQIFPFFFGLKDFTRELDECATFCSGIQIYRQLTSVLTAKSQFCFLS